MDSHSTPKIRHTRREFLRTVGKRFSVNAMLEKDSVKSRLEQREQGISYTEFTYQLLQAYDFLTLYDRYGCRLQMGGSDQWGNITAGCDLIRKLRGGQAHALVLPLVTTAAGVKFGKTEAGTVWLDPQRTSPFRFYQFWLHTDDRDVVTYLKFFTFLDEPTIAALERSVAETPEKREAQRVLAREVTSMVHGREAVERAERAASLLFGEGITELNADEVLAVFDDVPSSEVEASRFEGDGVAVGVAVTATVRVTLAVLVGVGVALALATEGVAVRVADAVSVAVTDGTTELVGTGVAVALADGASVGVGVAIGCSG